MTRGTDAGFSVLETIIALVVFASVIVALQHSYLIAIRGVRQARQSGAALEIARIKLGALGIEQFLQVDQEDQGDIDAFHWHTSVTKYSPPSTVTLPPRIDAFWTIATVTWPDGRQMGSVELKTLKLQPSP